MSKQEFQKTIGGKIRKARLEKRLTQSELADICQINRATIIRIENGKVNCSSAILSKISNALKVDVGFFRSDQNNFLPTVELKEKFTLAQEEFLSQIFGSIPIGSALYSLLNFQSNLKKKRAIDFSKSLKKAFEDLMGRDLHAGDIQKEDVIDIMETVMLKVQRTKSQLKLIRYRNILLRQFIAPAQEYEVQSYMRLLEELNDVQIIMLVVVEEANPKIKKETFPIHLARFRREKPKVDKGIQRRVHIKIGNVDYPVSDAQISFLENDLESKGLIIASMDDQKNLVRDILKPTAIEVSKKLEQFRETNFEKMFYELTDFGKAFLDYIRSPENEN